MHNLLNFSSYGINTKRGFLPSEEPLTQLPSYYSAWDELAAEFTSLINARHFRRKVAELPVLDINQLTSSLEKERAFLLLTCFANGYVWEGYEASTRIPACIAQPLLALSEDIDRKPILTHSSICLYNWNRINQNEPISMENIKTLMQFHGGVDESWFYLITVEIEFIGGRFLQSLEHVYNHQDDISEVKSEMEKMVNAIKDMTKTLARMYEWCDPFIYHTRVRPFLTSFKEVTYEGENEQVISLHGGSAAQSALLQSIDAAFGVEHKNPHAFQYLNEMRKYMPKAHASFVKDVEASNIIKNLAMNHAELLDVYNEGLEALTEFRQTHLEIVAKYIMGQAAKNGPGHTGTGGTNPMTFLKSVKQDTEDRQVKVVEAK